MNRLFRVMRTKLVCLTATVSLLMTSTTAGQKKYQRPTINTPQTFRGDDGAADQNSIGDLKWFEVFQDEELQKLGSESDGPKL